MLDGSIPPAPPRVRCRQIGEADLEAIVALLTKGFVDRPPDYWRRGLERHRQRGTPAGCPVYGYMLESEGRAVGVLLTLYSTIEHEDRTSLRCNLSSWYVDPEFRPQAPMLDSAAQGRKDVTYLNVTPSPHTFAVQEARRFQRFCKGQVFAIPALNPVPRGMRIRLVSPDDLLDDLPDPERRLVRDHAGYGCICFVVTDNGQSQPFVFLQRKIGLFRRRIGSGPLPCFQLFYCRDATNLPRFAGALGRQLLKSFGMPWIVIDAAGPITGLVGRFFTGRAPKYYRGPNPVRLCDLAYTELVLFGP